MTLFRLWAPAAERVDLVLPHRRAPMLPRPRGHWELDLPEAGAGTRYAFSLDGGPPRPDPRSHDQPDGVHGLSRVVEHSAYPWRIQRFCAPPLSAALVYELHVGTFTPEGTLDGAIHHLDHLANLGVTHVELMPINAFDGARGWGYDGVCWYAPHRAYTGADGPAAVKRFVDACHARGLAVLLDVVYNHLGPSGNYLGQFGPYFSEAYTTPWGPAINLDGPGSDEVRQFICGSALLWLRDYRFDGLRLDAVHAFHDRSAVHLLEQLTAQVRRLEAAESRPLVVIAESDLNDPRVVRSPESGGYGCDAQWSDDFHHALHAVLTGERDGYYADFGSLAQLGKALANAYVYDGCWSGFRQRRHGRPPTSAAGALPGQRFLAYIQDHDQVGNRAAGDRLAAIVDDGRIKTAAAVVLLSPFVPMLFQGEEWGSRRPFQYFTDHQDPDLAEAVRRGRRSEFASSGWKPEDVPDPQDAETFRRSILDWAEPAEPRCAEVLRWYRRLAAIRREYPELADGRLDRVQVEFGEAAQWLAFRRGRIVAACNFGNQPRRIPLLRGDAELADQRSPRVLLSAHPENRAGPEAALVQPASTLVAAWEHARPPKGAV